MKLHKPIIASMHESHRPIRLRSLPRKVLVNFGQVISYTKCKLIINKHESVKKSIDKLAMKELYHMNDVCSFNYGNNFIDAVYPLVIKSVNHVKKHPHLSLVKSQEELDKVMYTFDRSKFYWEEFVTYDREFRVHVSRYKFSEVFSTEKISRRGKPWIRNLKSCVFRTKFDKPRNWSKIISHCKKALSLISLDIAGFDVAYRTEDDKFWIIELNSACGMKSETRKAYTRELNKIALLKQFTL